MPRAMTTSSPRWRSLRRHWPRFGAAAIEVIDSADLGDEDAELTVGDAQDHDLAWYATQELPFLLDLL